MKNVTIIPANASITVDLSGFNDVNQLNSAYEFVRDALLTEVENSIDRIFQEREDKIRWFEDFVAGK